jgi:hypothetical protein
MSHAAPLVGRFAAKLILDVLPAALASLIGGFLFTQFQASHTAASQPPAEQASPASAEMMQLVRDEHAVIFEYLKAEVAAQKHRLAAEDEEAARAVAEAKAAAAAEARRVAAAVISAKPAPQRSKAAPAPGANAATPVGAPLVIAQAGPSDGAAAGEAGAPPKTLKQRVIDATLHVVSAIGGIPSWIASMGDRMGGGSSPNAAPVGRMFTASS